MIDPAAEVEKVRAVLAAARQLTDENRPVDLAAVGNRLIALCDAVDRLPRDQAQPLAATLESLLGDLDALATALSDRFGGLPQLGDLAHSKDAAGAYGAASRHLVG